MVGDVLILSMLRVVAPVRVAGEKLPVTPLGSPETESVTVELNPPRGTISTPIGRLPPAMIEAPPVFKMKLGIYTVKEATCLMVPAFAVSVRG